MELKDDMTQLNNLLDLLEDSRKGYHEAGERAEDPHVKALLDDLSQSRLALINEVDELRQKAEPGAPPRAAGTLKGDLHRIWIDIRDALSTSENANVLSECERGEHYLLSRYENMQEKEVSAGTFALAQRQRARVQANVERITQLRRRLEQVEH